MLETFPPLIRKRSFALLASAVLSFACGGSSGGDGPSSPQSPSSPQTPTNPQTPTTPQARTGAIVVNAGGSGAGSIATASGASTAIACTVTAGSTSGTCNVSLVTAAFVDLTATAAPGSAFTGWTGDCAGTVASCRLTGGQTASATFSNSPGTVTLRLSTAGAGAGSVAMTPGGATCTRASDTAPNASCDISAPQGQGTILDATSVTGSTFAGWTGACQGTLTRCTVQLTQAAFVTARFEKAAVSRTLTITGAGLGIGRVRTSDGTIDCRVEGGRTTGSCSSTFPSGTVAKLTAETVAGASFDAFSGGCLSTNSTCDVVLDQDRATTASFGVASGYAAIRVAPRDLQTGSGVITSSVAGISCDVTASSASGTCLGIFRTGTTVTLQATPAVGSVFLAWAPPTACASPTLPTCALAIQSNATITVAWGARTSNNSALTVSGTGGGRVVSEPAAIDCTVSTPSTGSCSASFPAGTLVTLRATPPTGGTFVAWGGACGGNLLSCQVQLSQDQSVAATFNPAPAPTFAVTVAAGVNTRPGVVTSSPAGISCTIGPSGTAGTCVSRFVTGTQVTLHAQPTTGTDMLTTWGNENPCNNGVTADCTVTLLQSLTFAPVLVPSVEVRVVADSFPGNGKGTLSAVLGVGGPRITDFDCTYTAGVLSGKCATRVPLGAIVQISQTYGAGTVVGGVIDCTGGAFAWNVESGTCNVTASADRVVQVRYVQYLEYYFTAAMQVEGLSNGEPLPTPLPVVRCEPACGSFTPATARRSIPIAQGATSLTFTTVMDTAVWLPFSAVIGDATDCPDVPPNTIAGCVVPDRFFLLRFPNVMNYHQVFVPRSRSTKVVVEPFPGSSIRTVGPRFPRCAPSAVGGPRNACVAGLIDGGIAAYAQTGGTQWDPPCMLVTDSSFPGQQLCRVVFSGAGTTIVVRNKP